MFLHCTGGVKNSIPFEKPCMTPQSHLEEVSSNSLLCIENLLEPKRKQKFLGILVRQIIKLLSGTGRDKLALTNISNNLPLWLTLTHIDQRLIVKGRKMIVPPWRTMPALFQSESNNATTSLANSVPVNNIFSLTLNQSFSSLGSFVVVKKNWQGKGVQEKIVLF